MPACTWLQQHELNKPTSNEEINSLLEEVRAVTGEEYQIIEYVRTKKGLFGHDSSWGGRKWYEYGLFYPTIPPEYQCINFYHEHIDGFEIRVGESADVIAANLYGILNGVRHAKESAEKDTDGYKGLLRRWLENANNPDAKLYSDTVKVLR